MGGFIENRNANMGVAQENMIFQYVRDTDRDGSDEITLSIDTRSADHFVIDKETHAPKKVKTYIYDQLGRGLLITNFVDKETGLLVSRNAFNTGSHMSPNELDELAADRLRIFISLQMNRFEDDMKTLATNFKDYAFEPATARARWMKLPPKASLQDKFEALYDVEGLNDIECKTGALLDYAQLHYEYIQAAKYLADNDFKDAAGQDYDLGDAGKSIDRMLAAVSTPPDGRHASFEKFSRYAAGYPIHFLFSVFDEQAEELAVKGQAPSK